MPLLLLSTVLEVPANAVKKKKKKRKHVRKHIRITKRNLKQSLFKDNMFAYVNVLAESTHKPTELSSKFCKVTSES